MVLAVPAVEAQLPLCGDGGHTRQCQIPPMSGILVPPDSIQGDMEFAGHPVSVALRASRRISRDSTALVIDLEMIAIETVKDSTWIAGTESVVLFTADPGWTIAELPELPLGVSDSVAMVVRGKDPVTLTPERITADRLENEGMCTRHPSDVCYNTTDNGVVAQWTVWGDSGRRDLGETKVSVRFASLGLIMKRNAMPVVSDNTTR
jgi:hypothetical protein